MKPVSDKGKICVYKWTCQFEKPSFKALLEELDPEVQGLYQDLRKSTINTLKQSPKLEWIGVSWQWCEQTELEPGGMLIAVYLIPDPESPRVALTFSTSFFEHNPPSTLSKLLHAGLSTARTIGHQTWCEWPISSQDQIEAIIETMMLANGT